jgi:hypothetical protein
MSFNLLQKKKKTMFSLYPSNRLIVVMVHCSTDARIKSKLTVCVIVVNSEASELYINRTLKKKPTTSKSFCFLWHEYAYVRLSHGLIRNACGGVLTCEAAAIRTQ